MPKKNVKKKSVRKAVKKSYSKKVRARPARSVSKPMPAIRPTRNRFNLVIRNLILFAVLTVISYLLYSISGTVSYQTFFYALTIILGFFSLAFAISLVILFFLRLMRR